MRIGKAGAQPHEIAHGFFGSQGLRVGVALVFVLALGVRIGWVVCVQSPAASVHSDMAGYVARAAHLGATIAGEPAKGLDLVLWPYGTHYLLALPLALDGGGHAKVIADPGEWMARNTPYLTIALQVALSAGSVLLVMLLAIRSFPGRFWPPLIVGVVAALWPPTLSQVGFFLSEVPFTFFALLSLWAWSRYAQTRAGPGSAWLAGVVTAVGFTIRAQIALTAALGLVWMFFTRRRVRGFRWMDLAGLAVPLLVVILLSAVRFHDLTGRWALISDNAAISRFFASTDYGAVRNDRGHAMRPASRTRALGFSEDFTVPGRIADAKPLDDERQKVWDAKTAGERVATLLRNVRLLVSGSDLWPERNAVRYAMQHASRNGERLTADQREAIRNRHEWRGSLQRAAAQLLLWVVLPLAALGALGLARRRDPVIELGVLHLVALVITAALYFAEPRYRAAYDPLLLLLAGHGIVGAWDARASPLMWQSRTVPESTNPVANSKWVRPGFLVAVLMAIAAALVVVARNVETDSPPARGTQGFELPESHRSAVAPLSWEATAADDRFLAELRDRLASGTEISVEDAVLRADFEATGFPSRFTTATVTVFEHGRKRLLVARRGEGWRALAAALERVRHHPRYSDFDFMAADRNRIQIDFIVDPPSPVDLRSLELGAEGERRFEPGVDGFRIEHDGDVHYFLPGDAFVRSIMLGEHLRSYLKRLARAADLDELEARRFVSETYISNGETWLRLYRGIPVRPPVRETDLRVAVDRAIRHVVDHMSDAGSFMYYYDAARDSHRDREHPRRDPETNPYYNILRHGGGALLLVQDYERRGDPEVLAAAVRAIDFLVAQIRPYILPDGRDAGYVYYNSKAKLGGSGIALVVLAEYQRVTGDDRYRDQATRLASHLRAEIGETGEFRYYHIHLDRPVQWEENHDHFSFYYPGEAVLGLAKYHNVLATPSERPGLREDLQRALHFLIEVRPSVHAEHYRSLPADSWLMMGIDEAWRAPELRDDRHAAFVFADADAMTEHMYTREDALYPDYPGSFYYEYGNFPYADGARAEGLLAAFELASKIADTERVRRYGDALERLANATLRLVNTPEALYFADRPELAVGGIRFKHTRQWFRIDTTQHVAAFYLKMLPGWSRISD